MRPASGFDLDVSPKVQAARDNAPLKQPHKFRLFISPLKRRTRHGDTRDANENYSSAPLADIPEEEFRRVTPRGAGQSVDAAWALAITRIIVRLLRSARSSVGSVGSTAGNPVETGVCTPDRCAGNQTRHRQTS